MQRKVLMIFLTLVLVLSVLGGCAPNTDTNTSTNTGTDTSQIKEVTINVSGWNAAEEVVKPIFDKFYADNPGIKINYSYLLFQDFTEKLKVDFSSGNPPDIAEYATGSMLSAFASNLEPLAGYASKQWGSDWKDKFIPLTIQQVERSGKEIFAIPQNYGLAGNLWYYKAKLDKNSIKVPTTFDELKQANNVLRQNNDLGFVIGAKDLWVCYDVFGVIASDFNKDKYYGAIEGTAKWTDPDLMKAFAAWQSIFTDKLAQDGAISESMYPTVAADNFGKKGMGAFIPCGDWFMANFVTDDTKSVADSQVLTVMPFPDVNGDGKPCPVTITTHVSYGMNKKASADVKDAAWKYINWFVTKGIVELNKAGYWPPAFKDAKVDYAISDTGKAAVKSFNELANNIAGDRDILYPDVNKALGDALQALAIGNDLETTINKLQAESEKAKRD